MDHFLLVTPPAWIEVLNFTEAIRPHAVDSIQQVINERDWVNMSAYALYWGIITEFEQIIAARIFVTGEPDNPARFWMQKAPI